MAKMSRNAPCRCGSGKKYKRCCLTKDQAAAEKTVRQDSVPAAAPKTIRYQQDDYTDLTNSVLDLIEAGKLEEAKTACAELKRRYPQQLDWMERTGMIHEAQGENEKAIEYYQRCLDHIQQNKDLFGDRFKEWYIQSIERLKKDPGTTSKGETTL